MKKLLFAASLFTVVALGAQETQERKRPERPSAEQQVKQFDDYGLSPDQKQKIQALYKERESKFEKNKPSGTKDGQRPEPPKGGQKPDDSKVKGQFEKENKEFDGKIQKILTKEQFAKYQANQKQNKDGQKKGSQKPERKRQD